MYLVIYLTQEIFLWEVSLSGLYGLLANVHFMQRGRESEREWKAKLGLVSTDSGIQDGENVVYSPSGLL